MLGELRQINKLIRQLADTPLSLLIRKRIDGEVYSIDRFMRFASALIKPSDRLLDAGAGTRPYRKYFCHSNYESTDITEPTGAGLGKKHTFICNLEKIPAPKEHYDAVINTQVLEHVKNPQKAINEFYRILKYGGKLFLTAPQGLNLHGAPHHYFNFTKYGLEQLFKNAGFNIEFIKPRGGAFWLLGKIIKDFPITLLIPHFVQKSDSGSKIQVKPHFFILLPICLVLFPIYGLVIPMLLFYLDWLDLRKEYTLGYACYCTKQK